MQQESDYLKDALAFSSKRRVMFVRLYQGICADLGYKQVSENMLVDALESIHASATIIDDMLDHDYLRKDFPTYYVRHGNPVAAFAALNLMIRGIELIGSSTAGDLRAVLVILRQMIDAEEADVGLRRRPPGVSPLEWYRTVVSKKIAGELLLILLLCSKGAEALNTLSLEFENVTCLLGQFIQYCDDWYDTLIKDPFTKSTRENVHVVTYSLPFAIYLDNTEDQEIEAFVGARIDRSCAVTIIEKISVASNRLRVQEFIQVEYDELMKSIRSSTIPRSSELLKIVEAVRTEEYWERTYELT